MVPNARRRPQAELAFIVCQNRATFMRNSENTAGFIKLYFGNNAINTTELQYILPI